MIKRKGGLEVKNLIKLICVSMVICALTGCNDNAAARQEIANERYESVNTDGNTDILVELGIAEKEDLDKDEYITNLEVLEILHKIIGTPFESGDYRDWYRGMTFEPLDYLDDYYKKVILDIAVYDFKRTITSDDVLNMRFDENITNYNALLYITRLIEDFYESDYNSEEFEFTAKVPLYKKTQIYNKAFQKSIIDYTDTENADLPMTRKDFFEIISKAIFVEWTFEGYTTTQERYIDIIISRNESLSQPVKEVKVTTNEISPQITINRDMSISLSLPDEYDFLTCSDDLFSKIELITENGDKKDYSFSLRVINKIYTTEIIECILDVYPEKLEYMRVTCYMYNDSDRENKEEWYFDIDISNISIYIEGTPIEPGVYTNFKREWVPEKISLADGQLFKLNTYYVITSYENVYRRSEYNLTRRVVFQSLESANELTYLSGHDENGRPYFLTGGIPLKDVHIQEVTIQGNAETGFKIYITPESKTAFKVVEGSEHVYNQ